MRRLSRDENRLSSRIQKWKSESVFGKKLFDSIRFKRINVTFSKWTNVTVKTRQKPSCSEYFTLYRIDLCWTLLGAIKTRQCGSKWSIEKTNLRKENTTNNQQKQLLHEYLLEMSVSSDFLWNCGLFLSHLAAGKTRNLLGGSNKQPWLKIKSENWRQLRKFSGKSSCCQSSVQPPDSHSFKGWKVFCPSATFDGHRLQSPVVTSWFKGENTNRSVSPQSLCK